MAKDCYRPQTKLQEGDFFTVVCVYNSFCSRGGGVHPKGKEQQSLEEHRHPPRLGISGVL